MMMTEDEFEDGEAPPAEELTACKICGRSFFPKVLKKHMLVCQKIAAKKRKTFDSSRQRAEGTDISTLKPVKPKAVPPKKPSNWRRKHEDFIATIRAAKGITQVIKDGGPLPPPPPPSYDPDYIQCPCCQRRFSENAAERHIKFCREKAARMPKSKMAAGAAGAGQAFGRGEEGQRDRVPGSVGPVRVLSSAAEVRLRPDVRDPVQQARLRYSKEHPFWGHKSSIGGGPEDPAARLRIRLRLRLGQERPARWAEPAEDGGELQLQECRRRRGQRPLPPLRHQGSRGGGQVLLRVRRAQDVPVRVCVCMC
ncbi:hypothetical protein CRUP_024551 [Coryphaenoides rupestris]|nr:hypothetical protein CRUP_024551 [Coryphaenoides rupestris]